MLVDPALPAARVVIRSVHRPMPTFTRGRRTAAAACAFLVLAGLVVGWGPSSGDRGAAQERAATGPSPGGEEGVGGGGPPSAGEAEGVHATPREQKRVEGSFFVRLRPDLDPSTVADAMAREYGGEAAYVYEHALNGFNYRGSEQVEARLRSDPRVEAVDYDYEVHAAAETITKDVKRIRASHTIAAVQTSYAAGYTGAGVYIGIIDTGIDYLHPDLAPNMAPQSMWRNCLGSGLPFDDYWHGTAIAGDAAARDNTVGVRGSAPRATLIPIKVLDSTGSGSSTSVACGVDHLTALANANPTKRFVGNMSLSGRGTASTCSSMSVRLAICTSVAAGVVYTAAAGNAGENAAGWWPASFPEVIAVSALQDTDGEPTSDDRLASFSNRGEVVDVMAPGVSVFAPYPGNRYSTSSGTSHSAPFVAGVAALALAIDPSLTPATVRSLLRSTGECPGGTFNASSGNCPSSAGSWPNDPDGFAEPLVRAFEATDAIDVGRPEVSWLEPTTGAVLTGNDAAVGFAVTDRDDSGAIEQATVASVELRVGSTSVRTWSAPSTGTFDHRIDTSAFTPDGPKTLTVRVVDLDGKEASASLPVTFSNAPPWVEDFEAEASAAAGWTFTGLWHAADGGPGSEVVCPWDPYTSYRHGLYYGHDGRCDYHTGGSNTGTATSPVIGGLGPQVEVGFSSLRVIERHTKVRERTSVQVSYNGGSSWQTVWTRTSRDPNDTDWVQESFVLTPPNGSLQLRFVFQANKNNNAFPGWFVDDVVVGGANDVPEVQWHDPDNGAAVWGDTIPIAFSDGDEDAEGTLEAEWFVDGVSMGSPGYEVSSGRYEAGWTTAGHGDGWHTLEARLNDSGEAVGRAFLDVWLDTADDAPEVSWAGPSDGATVVTGSVPLRIAAPDDRDAPGDVGVQWFVDGTPAGTGTYASGSGLYEATWDTSGLAEGPYTLRAQATDGTGLWAAAEITVQVVDAALYQDFEQSFDGWTTSGLWSIQENLSCGGGATYASASRAAYYGNPSTCQYNTGSRNSGRLVSPGFDIGGPATLTFSYRREVQSSSKFRDVTFVDVSYDGGSSWQRVWQRSAMDPSSPDWETASIPLGSSGGTVRVRFGFDTMDKDNNKFLGWIVDDVLIVED